MPILNAFMTKAYNLTCQAITCIKAIRMSGFMLLSPLSLKCQTAQTASKWQITRSIIIWLNHITNTINKPSFSQLYFEIYLLNVLIPFFVTLCLYFYSCEYKYTKQLNWAIINPRGLLYFEMEMILFAYRSQKIEVYCLRVCDAYMYRENRILL
jgi:hypothetical protein